MLPGIKNQLLPMIDTIQRQSGQKAGEVLAGSGYCSELNLNEAAGKKIELPVLRYHLQRRLGLRSDEKQGDSLQNAAKWRTVHLRV